MTRRCPRADSCGLVVLLLATLSACGPLRLLRPRVLEQLTPPVVDLVDYLPNVDEPNKAVLARLFATGGLTKARLHPDGVMRAAMRIRRDRLIYEPSIIVVTTGWGGRVKGFAPELAAAPRGGALFVFALP
jgi:hypothetical protein